MLPSVFANLSAAGPKNNDKRMTHMPTPEDDVLSFVQLSELQRVVRTHNAR